MAAWLTALAPPAFVLVMGYSEPLFLCLVVAAFLWMRQGRWWSVAGAGFLAGLTRPVGDEGIVAVDFGGCPRPVVEEHERFVGGQREGAADKERPAVAAALFRVALTHQEMGIRPAVD